MNSVSIDTHVVVLLLGSRSHARWTHFTDAAGWVAVPLLSTGQALRELRSRRPFLAVMELSAPIDRSLRLLRLLRVRRPNLPVIVVPARHTRQTELSVRQIGAAGYVPEGCGSCELTSLVTALLDRTALRQGAGGRPTPRGHVPGIAPIDLDRGTLHDAGSVEYRMRFSERGETGFGVRPDER